MQFLLFSLGEESSDRHEVLGSKGAADVSVSFT